MERQEQKVKLRRSTTTLARAPGSGPLSWRMTVVALASLFVVGCFAEDGPQAEALATSEGALTAEQCNWFASLDGDGNDRKVAICHATGSARNPYRVISVSVDACHDDSGHTSHPGDFLAVESADGTVCGPNACLPAGAPWDPVIPCCAIDNLFINDDGVCEACPAGYTGDGVTCTDIDECDLGTDNCDANSTCENNDGGYTCPCDGGYELGCDNQLTLYVADGLVRGTPYWDTVMDSNNDFVCWRNVDMNGKTTAEVFYSNDGVYGSNAVNIRYFAAPDYGPLELPNCEEVSGGPSSDCMAAISIAGIQDEKPNNETICLIGVFATGTSVPAITKLVLTNGCDLSVDGICLDINECAETSEAKTDDCDPLVECLNADGGFVCGLCPDGYLDVNDDGTLCENECVSSVVASGTLTKTAGCGENVTPFSVPSTGENTMILVNFNNSPAVTWVKAGVAIPDSVVYTPFTQLLGTNTWYLLDPPSGNVGIYWHHASCSGQDDLTIEVFDNVDQGNPFDDYGQINSNCSASPITLEVQSGQKSTTGWQGTEDIMTATGASVCWDGVNMSGFTQAELLYSTGEASNVAGTNSVDITFGGVNIGTIALPWCIVGGAWSGNCEYASATFAAQSGSDTLCLVGVKYNGTFLAAISELVLK